jgi:hypothetical protein
MRDELMCMSAERSSHLICKPRCPELKISLLMLVGNMAAADVNEVCTAMPLIDNGMQLELDHTSEHPRPYQSALKTMLAC